MKTEKEIEELIDSVKIPSDEEVEAAGRRFDKRIRQIRRRRQFAWGTGSVAAVLLCGVIFVLLQPKEEVQEQTSVLPVVKTENEVTAPTLILSDGNSVNLNDGQTDTMLRRSNIQLADKHIKYDTTPAVREVAYNTLVIPTGFTYDVTLADGTLVTLNAGSRLKYPETFVGEQREVELEGEGFFNVEKSEKPFVVKVLESRIRVYGTRFNVKTSPRKTVETVLVEVRIGFKSPGQDEVQVVPGQQVEYNPESGFVSIEQVDVRYAIAWLKGVFKYQDKPLNFILEDLSTWYGVTFEPRVDVTGIKITMNLSKKTSIDEVIAFLKLMTNREFIEERGNYIIE